MNHATLTRNLLLAGGGLALLGYAMRQRRRISFRGKSVVIAGGSRGLGLAIARQLAAEGADLTLIGRDRDELERAAADVRSSGALVLSVRCDVRDKQQIHQAVSRIVGHYGGIDVLINLAGVIQAGPTEHMDEQDYLDAMAIHCWGPLRLMDEVVPIMKQRGGGRIVNVASIGGLVSLPHVVPYCTSKFALVGLSTGLSAELSRHRIHVTTICPGLMRTGSHLNAMFKGQHRKEFAWFAVGNALPMASISVERAARQIIRACRYAEPFRVITVQARALHLFGALMPSLFLRTMRIVNRMLPSPTDDARGDELRRGKESRSRLAPRWLTRLSDRAAGSHNE